MTNGILRVMLVAAALSLFAASAVLGADAPAQPKPAPAPAPAPAPVPAPVTMVGTVSVVKDANGVITAVKLTTEDKVAHNVVLDKEGLELGSKMAGKKVEAQIIKKGADVKVVSYKVVEDPEEEPEE